MVETKSRWRETLEALLIAVIFLRFANTFVAQTFYIPSESMENTLLVGDHLFVNRFIFGQETLGGRLPFLPSRPISRGDIVIFRSVENPLLDVVKRCVGVPGDTIEVRAKQLFLNGNEVDESAYVQHKLPGERSAQPAVRALVHARDNFGPFQVPPDHYFVMGDNRDQSHDSRFWGALPADRIKGRAFFIYWSYGGETSDGQWHGLGQKLGQLARTAGGFFTKSRWGRTFGLIR